MLLLATIASAHATCGTLARDLDACLSGGDTLATCAPTSPDPVWPVYEACCTRVSARACDATCASTAPLALNPVASPDLALAADAYSAGCGQVGTWCSMQAPQASRMAPCTDLDVAMSDVLDMVLAPLRIDPAWGSLVTPADLAGHPFFGTSYSSGGPGVEAALRSWSRGTPLIWELTQEVPCHNCTDFSSQVVVWWPLTGDVVLLDGTFGYDS
ncbi:MAG: hypothetical protein H6738_13255 [Alphaproteobacteria bacterium]|nr:hypothetical protein [Alphaproteobacteria bacterium]MCB9697744.1 hypothetical protein [Alphaproteobacteria bacterium]